MFTNQAVLLETKPNKTTPVNIRNISPYEEQLQSLLMIFFLQYNEWTIQQTMNNFEVNPTGGITENKMRNHTEKTLGNLVYNKTNTGNTLFQPLPTPFWISLWKDFPEYVQFHVDHYADKNGFSR